MSRASHHLISSIYPVPGIGVMGSSMRNMAPFPSDRGNACMPVVERGVNVDENDGDERNGHR